MAIIYNFPNSIDCDWIGIKKILIDSFASIPDGAATLEECMPAIQSHWQAIFTEFSSVQPTFQIPEPITQAQQAAIYSAVDAGVQLVAKQLKYERNKHFGLLVQCEFNAAYFRRNGITL